MQQVNQINGLMCKKYVIIISRAFIPWNYKCDSKHVMKKVIRGER